MPDHQGKCTNTAQCQLAIEGRIITVSGEPRCPECGEPLQTVAGQERKMLPRLLFALAWFVVFAAAIALGWKLSRPGNSPDTPASPVEATATSTPIPTGQVKVTTAERNEVLKRIDMMPNLSAASKERFYAYVERAQRIDRAMVINFQEGKTRLTEPEVRKVEARSKEPEFARAAHDPATVFVVLGYADKRGDETKNLQLSLDRATHVADLLRKRCGILNIVQAVPMGSAFLFDPRNSSENRVAEVWSAVP